MLNTPKILADVRNHEGAVGSGWSLKRKLFGYMLLLVCLLLLVLVTGMFLLGQFSSTEQDTFDALDMQMENIKNVSLLILLLLAAISCCYYFSRRFLTPILRSLEQLKSDTLEEMDYDIPEITDLFEFLSQKDGEHEKTLITLKQEKQDVQTAKDSLLQEYEKVQSEHCKTQTEIDPDAYAHFLEGIEPLTSTERKIFSHYLDGLTVKEIAQLLSVKESTVYSHNKNIYSKLGINSLKQLLRYAALMRQQEKEAAGQV